jgi:hypothetical protein
MAWNELLSTDVGLLSLFTIGFVLVIGGFIYRFAVRNMEEDARKAQAAQKS